MAIMPQFKNLVRTKESLTKEANNMKKKMQNQRKKQQNFLKFKLYLVYYKNLLMISRKLPSNKKLVNFKTDLKSPLK